MVQFSARKNRRKSKKTQAVFAKLSKKIPAPGYYFQKNKFIFLGLGLVIVAVFIAELWHNLRFSVWDGQTQLNLAIAQGNSLSYIKINPELEEVLQVTFPDNAMVEVARGYQDYQAGKVVRLAEQEHIKTGQLISQTMTVFLGSLTDGYITSSAQSSTFSNLVFKALTKRASTNLSTWDLIRVWLLLQNARSDQMKIVDISKTEVYQLITLPDGTEVYQANYDLLDEWVLRELARPEFLRQTWRWEIFNSTDHTGLGQTVKRIIANSGLEVVGVRQETAFSKQSTLYIKTQIDNDIVTTKLAKYLDLNTVFSSPESRGSAADIDIVIGEDFWDRFFTN